MRSLLVGAQGASFDVQRKQSHKNNLLFDPHKPELVVFLQESDYQFVNDILMERDLSNFKNQEADGGDARFSNGEEQNGSGIHPSKSLVSTASSLEDSLQNESHLKQRGTYNPDQCSGSHRSTASTASNQSFAFPVMPPEWPESPVRMAEPDKRQLRKQQCWKICCLCCKF